MGRISPWDLGVMRGWIGKEDGCAFGLPSASVPLYPGGYQDQVRAPPTCSSEGTPLAIDPWFTPSAKGIVVLHSRQGIGRELVRLRALAHNCGLQDWPLPFSGARFVVGPRRWRPGG